MHQAGCRDTKETAHGDVGGGSQSSRHWLPLASVDCGIAPTDLHFSHSSTTFSAVAASSLVIATEAPICTAARPPTAAVQSAPATISIFREAAGGASGAAPFTAFLAKTELQPTGMDVSEKSVAVWDGEAVEVHSTEAMKGASSVGGSAAAAVRRLQHSAPPLGLAVHNDVLLRCASGGVEVVAVEDGEVRSTLEVPLALGRPVAVSINGSTLVAVTSALHLRSYTLRGHSIREAGSTQVRLEGTAGAEALSAESVGVGAARVAPGGSHCALLFVAAGAEAGEADMMSVVAVHNLETGATLTHGATFAA